LCFSRRPPCACSEDGKWGPANNAQICGALIRRPWKESARFLFPARLLIESALCVLVSPCARCSKTNNNDRLR
jgi:hypothetical protein